MFPIGLENVNLDSLFEKIAVDISSVDVSDVAFELKDEEDMITLFKNMAPHMMKSATSSVSHKFEKDISAVLQENAEPKSNVTQEEMLNQKEFVCITGMSAEYDERKVDEQSAEYMTSEYEQELIKSQKKLITMLKEFHEICKNYDINYWCIHDTFHGVLCAKKMLPWSAKIEVGMHNDDYEALLLNKHKFSSHLFFQTKETDPYYDMHNIYKAQIRDINSHYSEFSEKYKIWHNGLSLCIHVYDDVSDNRIRGSGMSYETSEFSKDVFLPPEKLEFEGFEVYVPNMFNMMCATLYGEYPPPLFTQLKKTVKEGRVNSSEPHEFMIEKYPQLYKNYHK